MAPNPKPLSKSAPLGLLLLGGERAWRPQTTRGSRDLHMSVRFWGCRSRGLGLRFRTFSIGSKLRQGPLITRVALFPVFSLNKGTLT